MAPLPKWKPRKTLIDLYVERDQTHWYWRLIASIPAASIMIGHVLESSETADSLADTLQLPNLSLVFPQRSSRIVKIEKLWHHCWNIPGGRVCLVGSPRTDLQKLAIPDGCDFRVRTPLT